MPPSMSGVTSFKPTIRPTRKATSPHTAVAIMKRWTIALSYSKRSTDEDMGIPSAGRWHGGDGVVEQDADGRRGGVVELAGAHGPDERGQEAAGHEAAGGDEEADDAHGASLRACGRISPGLSATMVSELTGIRMALASGVSRPATARPSPPTL